MLTDSWTLYLIVAATWGIIMLSIEVDRLVEQRKHKREEPTDGR